jgi:hypothetical protein
MSHEVMSLRLSEQTGATPVTERSLAPDLARGFMLLWITLPTAGRPDTPGTASMRRLRDD